MLPLVLRCLAVYGVTAGLALWMVHRWVLPLKAPVALAIALAPLLFTGRATLTGGVYAPVDILFHNAPFASRRFELGITKVQTPLLSDVVSSMIPWQHAVREAVKNGRAPLWNPFVLAGEPLLAVQQPAVLHPGTWLGLLLPLPQAWTFQMSLRLLIALLSAYLFLRDIGCRDAPSLLGAFGWGFSDFMVFWVAYPVGNAVGPFPLLLLGLGRLVRDSDRRAVALTATALVLIITAGHPETLLFAVTGAGVYFLFELGFAGRGRRLRPLLLSLLGGALALGLTAIQLLPLKEALPQTWEHAFRSGWYAHEKKSVSPRESVRRAVPILLPFAYGESGHGMLEGQFGIPSVYAGSILLPLVIPGLFSRNRSRWAFLALGLIGVALWTRLEVVTDAVAALPLLDIGVLDYLVFLAVFAVAALAALGADRLCDGEGVPAFLAGAALCALGIGYLYLHREPAMKQLAMSPEFLRRRVLCEIVPLLLGAVLIGWARRLPRARRTAIALLPLLLAPRMAEAGSVYPTYSESTFFPHLPVLDGIPRGAPDRVVGVAFTLVPNASAVYEIEDVRGYESMTFRPLYETYPLWCTPQGVWFNRVDDLTKPFLSFLNVRYAIVPSGYPAPARWRTLSRDPGADLLENAGVLARAFVPSSIHYEPDGKKQIEALAQISDFAEQGVLGVPAPSSSGPWVSNGRARVTIVSYLPQSMGLAVDAEAEAVVATSVTAWRGWKARLDGVAVEPLSYNHAFLAFRVPKGRHRLELRYLPDGFTVGTALSLLTLGAAVVLSRRRRSANAAAALQAQRPPAKKP